MSQIFGAGVGPILLDNVTCDQSHSELLQCVHPLDIGIHNCNQENVAGVICPILSISPSTTTNISPNIISTEITPQNTSTLFFGNSSLAMTSISSLDMTLFAMSTQ